jgi:hypothetical protein
MGYVSIMLEVGKLQTDKDVTGAAYHESPATVV